MVRFAICTGRWLLLSSGKERRMSGGSHGHIYNQIQDELCGQMYDIELNDLMEDIAKLAHDLEWYDSSDISKESYEKNSRRVQEKMV